MKILNEPQWSQAIPIKFADIIYKIHDDCLATLRDFGIKTKRGKDRKLLQLLGTDWGRSIDVDLWVKATQFRVNQHIEQRQSFDLLDEFYVIIDDCRFPNELDAFPDAVKIRLESSEKLRLERAESWGDSQHESETALDGHVHSFDMIIQNENINIDQMVSVALNKIQKVER